MYPKRHRHLSRIPPWTPKHHCKLEGIFPTIKNGNSTRGNGRREEIVGSNTTINVPKMFSIDPDNGELGVEGEVNCGEYNVGVQAREGSQLALHSSCKCCEWQWQCPSSDGKFPF
ncbi:unnamed protein product [Caretta caretta]